MRISIITIAYNSAETIEATIQSVIAQDYTDVEYIIIDGASKDATMDVVDRYRDQIAVVVSESDKGIYDAMNKGVARATGEVVGILNSDDFYADNTVLSDVAARFRETGADAVYADLVYVERDNPDKVVRYWKSKPYKPGMFRKGWMPAHPTFFLKNECYRAHGTYSTELRSAADYELMLRMLEKHAISAVHLPRLLTKMRVGGHSNVSLKNRIRANKEDRRAWKMNGLTPAWYTLTVKPLSKLTQFIRK
ncbi:MAG: glycosyltransferase family 2 protein [Flavobacteriales bacterium]